MNNQNGWANWEAKLNHKVEERRKAQARKAASRLMLVALSQAVLFVFSAIVLIIGSLCGFHPMSYFPIVAAALCTMTFIAGYAIGRRYL